MDLKYSNRLVKDLNKFTLIDFINQLIDRCIVAKKYNKSLSKINMIYDLIKVRDSVKKLKDTSNTSTEETYKNTSKKLRLLGYTCVYGKSHISILLKVSNEVPTHLIVSDEGIRTSPATDLTVSIPTEVQNIIGNLMINKKRS